MKDQSPPTTDPAASAAEEIDNLVADSFFDAEASTRLRPDFVSIIRKHLPQSSRLAQAEKVIGQLKLCIEGYFSENVRKNTPQIRAALTAAKQFMEATKSES